MTTLTPTTGTSTFPLSRTATIALGATAAVAATAAGLAIARRTSSERSPDVYEVRSHERGWQLRREDGDQAVRVFTTKKEAVKAARELVASKAPSELRIFTEGDRLLDHHRYEESEG